MLTQQVASVKRDRTSGQSLVGEPQRGRGSRSRADGDAASHKLQSEEENDIIIQNTVSPSAFIYPRSLSVDLLLENGSVLSW
jgi:hypothetical protein